MMDEEAVWLPVELAVRAQRGADLLGLLAGIGEDQALAPARVLENVAHAGVGVGGRHVSRGLVRRGHNPRAQLCRRALCADAARVRGQRPRLR